MKNVLSEMIRLPLKMAQFGIEQMQFMIDHQDDTQSDNRADKLFTPSQGTMHRTQNGTQIGSPQDLQSMLAHASNDEKSSDSIPAPFVFPEQFGRLDVTRMVAIGDCLAAGLNGFGQTVEPQSQSFPAQLAQHLGANFTLPLIQPPGIGDALRDCSVQLPNIGQTTVFSEFPSSASFANCSIPGITVADALHMRPKPPFIHRKDPKQTAVNFLIEPRCLIEGNSDKHPTLVESCLLQKPTFLIVSLGFNDVLDQVVRKSRGAGTRTKANFSRDYCKILDAAAVSTPSIVVLTVPNPIDTALFSTLASAATVLKTTPTALRELYELNEDDLLTIEGLVEIGLQINARMISPLKSCFVLTAEEARRLSEHVSWLNEEITRLADKYKATIADIAGFTRRLKENVVRVNGKELNAHFLGGFYSLDGYTPGATGHALIANEIINAVNRGFAASIPSIDSAKLIPHDPVADCQPAGGRTWTIDELRNMPSCKSNDFSPASKSTAQNRRNKTSRSKFSTMEEQYNAIYRDPPAQPLVLPPGLEQELPLDSGFSYFGDAISAVNCAESDKYNETGCPSPLFGGLAMTSSGLNGSIKIRFTPPLNGTTRFEVVLDNGLFGADGVLAAPNLLRLPVRRGFVGVFPGKTCTGELNLTTGATTNLDFNFLFGNSALEALVKVNPDFPKVPISFPGQYGTALVRFIQRDDGNLDFVFSGTAFAPIGPTARFPFPFESASGEMASVPAHGTALHPHIHLSTVNLSVECMESNEKLDLPSNTIREFTTTVSKTSFGDDFTLNNPALGFARGRSQLTGRALIQFGERFGDLLPFAVSVVPPGGSLFPQDISLLQNLFPGRLNQGLLGHDTVLRFPKRTYRTNDMYVMNDPFDIPWGVVNVKTGEVSGDFLHRAFFGQDVFFALVRVEPRTPQGSFEYRGPALFEQDNGQLRYRFNGTVFLPYQEGFLFPKPNLADGFVIGPDSALDPFFQVDAVSKMLDRTGRGSGSKSQQISTTGDIFSFSYRISSDAMNEKPFFEYTNHSQGGTFALCSLTWVNFTNASGKQSNEFDTVTFSGFGTWSLDDKNELHSVSVQISTMPLEPYVSILVGGGQVSNVNTHLQMTPPPLTAISARKRSAETSTSQKHD